MVLVTLKEMKEALGKYPARSVFTYSKKKLRNYTKVPEGGFVSHTALNLKSIIKLLERDIQVAPTNSRWKALWRSDYETIFPALEEWLEEIE